MGKYAYDGKADPVFWKKAAWPLLGYQGDYTAVPYGDGYTLEAAPDALPDNGGAPAEPTYFQPDGISYYLSPGGDVYTYTV